MTLGHVAYLALVFVALALVSMRLYWLVAVDVITSRPRGAYEKWTAQRGYSKAHAFVTCPWCIGFWIEAVLVLVLALTAWVSLPMPVLWVFALNMVTAPAIHWVDRFTA